MSEHDQREPLVPFAEDPTADPELRALFSSARADRPSVDVDAIARAASTPHPPPFWRRPLVRPIAISGVVLAAVLAWSARPTPPPPPAPPPPVTEIAAPIVPAPVEVAPVEVVPVEPAPVPHAPPRPRVTTVHEDTPEATADDGLREGTLLLRARRAIAAGDASAALDAVHTHETEFPHGAMEGEREVIGVQALAALGQNERAAARARHFLTEFPSSPYRAQVERILASVSNP